MKTLLSYIKIFFLLVRGKEPITELFFKNKKTLDIGCGQGDFLIKDPTNFIGIDINNELINRAKNRGLSVQKADVTSLPFPDNVFQGVYCVNVIEHLTPEKAYKMFEQVERVLGKDGVFVLGTEWPSRRIWDTFSHIRPYSPQAIKKIISEQHQETFSTIKNLYIENIFYKGMFTPIKWIRILLWIPALFVPFLRRDWLMVLRKK